MKLKRVSRQYDADEIDYQCNECHEIYRGPHKGDNPGKQVTTHKGAPVSHGYCERHDDTFRKEYDALQKKRREQKEKERGK